MIEIEWLNRPGPYCQYVQADLAPWRMRRLLELYPFFFDDLFWYWHPKTRRKAINRTIIIRSPLWTYPNKTIPAEKAARRKARNCMDQKQLLLGAQGKEASQ